MDALIFSSNESTISWEQAGKFDNYQKTFNLHIDIMNIKSPIMSKNAHFHTY